MKLREQFEKETGMAWINTQGEPDIEYVEWLETKLQNTPSNSDDAECVDEIMELFDSENNLYKHTLKRILERHFA